MKRNPAETVGLLHPDDLLFFNEVVAVMKNVARQYELPLLAVEPYPMPTEGLAECRGDCSANHVIRLVMRCTVGGQFVDMPRTPESIWETAAHELAHLRHFNHGQGFQAFNIEMRQAIENRRHDHRQRVIDKLVKIKAQRDDASKRAKETGSAEAANEAETFAGMLNSMMLREVISESEVNYARAQKDDPIVEIEVDLSKYRMEAKRTRIAWQESMARIVAEAHLCKFLIRTHSNHITFVGTKSHATVAEYSYGTLIASADKLCQHAYGEWGNENGRRLGTNKWTAAGIPGFKESWFYGFVKRIQERLAEVKAEAIAQAVSEMDQDGLTAQDASSMALVRLNGALVKAQRYVDDKFKSKRTIYGLGMSGGYNAAGREAGRAAANRMAIGRRGITGGASTPKQIGGRS